MYLPTMAGGGAERVFALLTGAFVERGFGVTLLLNQKRGPGLAYVDPAVDIRDLGASRSLAALPRLARYLRDEEPAALLSALEITNLVALWARKVARARTRVTVSVHTIVSRSIARHRNWQYRCLRPLMSKSYATADAIVAVSDAVAADLAALARLPRDRIVTVYNPLPANIHDRARADADAPWFADDARPTILGIGRLIAEKNFETLVRAFAIVRTRRDAQLVILGDGPERRKLEALASEAGISAHVRFGGHVADPFPYIRRAALVVCSSYSEGFGNVVAEALACGTPVVSTRCGGPQEILQQGKLGRLVAIGEPDEMAAAIEDTLARPLPTSLLIERAAEFHLSRVADAYLSVLLDRPRASREARF